MAVVGLAILAPLAGAQVAGHPLVGLVQNTNSLVRFATAAPATVGTPLAVTGLAPGDTLKAIDYRPNTGALYGIATDVTNAGVRTYVINLATGAATMVGGQVTLPLAMAWDISFDLFSDGIRVVNDQGSITSLDPDLGTVGSIANLNPPVDAIAWAMLDYPISTLFALNQSTNSLAIISNGGVRDVGPLGISFAGSTTAFDIAPNIGPNPAAYAALRPAGGLLTLYTVNLATGAATPAGRVGDGSLAIDDIAIVYPELTISPPTGTYTNRQNFDIALLVDAQGRALYDGIARLNGQEVTGALRACVRTGTTATGVVSLRCPNIGGAALGAGTHSFSVYLGLNDGTTVLRVVTWNVVAVTEP